MEEYSYYYKNDKFILMLNGKTIYEEEIDEPQNVEDTINELSEEGIIPNGCILIKMMNSI